MVLPFATLWDTQHCVLYSRTPLSTSTQHTQAVGDGSRHVLACGVLDELHVLHAVEECPENCAVGRSPYLSGAREGSAKD